jgi:triacylglycerol lipase
MSIPQLRSPIILVHGLLGYDQIRFGRWTLVEYFRRIGRALLAAGNRVLVPRLSPTAGIADRADQLSRYISEKAGAEPVHVIAHSLGGLDARYMISHLGMAERVLTLTTVGTPHRGSPCADVGVRYLAAVTRPLLDFLRIPYQAYFDLTTDSCREFNQRTPNAPNVRYFSIAGRIEGPWHSLHWLPGQKLIERVEGPNDGVVSVSSATWGESLDVWAGDHLNLINHPNPRAMWSGVWIDRTVLYGQLVRKLADLGY